MSKDADSITWWGDPASPTGLLGRGKMIPSCRTVGSEMFIVGWSMANGTMFDDVWWVWVHGHAP